MTIADNLTRLLDAKKNLKTSIESKDVSVDTTDSIDEYGDRIYSIVKDDSTDYTPIYNSLIDRTLDTISIENVTSIRDYFLFNDTNISTIYLYAPLTQIGNYAFAGCINLTTIYLYSMTAPVIFENSWGVSDETYSGYSNRTAGTNTIHIPANAKYTETDIDQSLNLFSADFGGFKIIRDL